MTFKFGIYQGKQYRLSEDRWGCTILRTENQALADDSFVCNGGTYEKLIKPEKVEDAYYMKNSAIYQGHHFAIIGGILGMYTICTGSKETADALGLDWIDRGSYGKEVRREEVHVFWEREQLYWDGKSWLPLGTLAMHLEEPKQAVVPMSRWADKDVLSYMEDVMGGYLREEMCWAIRGVEQIYRRRGQMLGRQDIPALVEQLGLPKKSRKERILEGMRAARAADPVAGRLFSEKGPEAWKRTEMRGVIEDYFNRGVGSEYNRTRRRKEFKSCYLIPEIREAFDAGIYYADRSRLTDLALHEKVSGYPLPQELAEYINCCWHGYICGILPGYPGRMTLFPVYQAVGGTYHDVLFKEWGGKYNISELEEEWRKRRGLPYYIPIGRHGSYAVEERFILYSRVTGEVYLESAKNGVTEEESAAPSLKEFIRRLSLLPGYRTEEELQKDIDRISMGEILQNYYEKNGHGPMPGYDRDNPNDTRVSWESFTEDGSYQVRTEAEKVIIRYEEEFGRPLPEEVADYMRSCWYTDWEGAYIGYYRGEGRQLWLCAPAPAGLDLRGTPYGLQGILYLTRKLKEGGGDIGRYVAVGRLAASIEKESGLLLYDREDGGIYYMAMGEETDKLQLVAVSLKEFILHLEWGEIPYSVSKGMHDLSR